jgi:hypothetical protein
MEYQELMAALLTYMHEQSPTPPVDTFVTFYAGLLHTLGKKHLVSEGELLKTLFDLSEEGLLSRIAQSPPTYAITKAGRKRAVEIAADQR